MFISLSWNWAIRSACIRYKKVRKFVRYCWSAHFCSRKGGFLWFIFVHQMVSKWKTRIWLLLVNHVDGIQIHWVWVWIHRVRVRIHQVQAHIHQNWIQLSWKWMSRRLMKLKCWSCIQGTQRTKLKIFIEVWSMVLSMLVVNNCMWTLKWWTIDASKYITCSAKSKKPTSNWRYMHRTTKAPSIFQSQSSLESSLQTQDTHLLLLWINFPSYQIMQLLVTNYKVRPKKIYSSAHGSMVKIGHTLSCHVSNDYRACSFGHQLIWNMIFLSIQN